MGGIIWITFTTCTFVLKIQDSCRIITPKMLFTWKCLGLISLSILTLVRACLSLGTFSQLAFFFRPKLGWEPTTRIMTNVDMVYKVSMGMYLNM
jgi:hypothetical protein